MIETISNAPELFGDFQLDADPITPVVVADKEVKEATDKINTIQGIAKTSDQAAEELSKLILEGLEPKEEEIKEDDKSSTEENKIEGNKPEEDKPTEDTKEDSYSFKAIVEYLDQEGVLEYDKELQELEDNPELLSFSINKKIETGIERFKESLPEVVAELVEYIELGGDPAKYLSSLYKPIDVSELDLGQENDQELVVREDLKIQGTDPNDIDELIESYKDGLILEKQAKVAAKRVDKFYGNQKQNLIKEQEAIVEENNKKSKEYIESIQNTVNNSKTLAGLEIADKEKKEFSDYLLKVNPKTNMTKYQEDLAKDYVKNSVELAYLKFKNYDFTKAKQSGKTEATLELKKKIFTKNEKAPSGKTDLDSKAVDFSGFNMFKNRK